jgi:hypothetical protein
MLVDVAGFDFYVRYREAELSLLRALLAKFQRVCRSYELEMHYRKNDDSRFYLTVDGPLPRMQALVPLLVTILPPFAEGSPPPPGREQRIRLANRLTKLYWEGVLDMAETIYAVAGYMSGTPNSLFFDTREHAPEIDNRLWSLSMALVAYENGMIGPAQMLEEIHTSLEWVMQMSIGSSARRLSYAQMAEALRDSGKLSAELCGMVIAMKDLRVGAKHRLQTVSPKLRQPR